MASVKRFLLDEPALARATAEYVKRLSNCADPVLYVAEKASTLHSKIAWTLLGTVLFQDRSYGNIVLLLKALFEKFPDEKLWTLPVPETEEIESLVESVFNSRNWSLFQHVPGIFWSVGNFVRHHPDLVAWVASRTAKEMWRDLGEIYFMGKGNPRPKACAAIYRIVSPAPPGLGCAYVESRHMPNLPLTMGARRFLSIMGPAREEDFSAMDASAKQKMANEFFASVFPSDPYKAAFSLQFFLEEGSDDFICREKTEGCKTCPLYEFCNYAIRRT